MVTVRHNLTEYGQFSYGSFADLRPLPLEWRQRNTRAKMISRAGLVTEVGSASMVLPWQFGTPGVPASGIVSPVRENVILNVGAVAPPPTTSVPIRSQSGARLELRIQACRSFGAGITFGADK